MPEPQPLSAPATAAPQLPAAQAAANAELSAVIAQQSALIQTQATVVRDLEGQLGIAPGGTPIVPGGSANLNNVIDIHTAAIRTQAAYARHLQDLQLANAAP